MAEIATIRAWAEDSPGLAGERWIGLFRPGETNNHGVGRVASCRLTHRGVWACSFPDWRPHEYPTEAAAVAALERCRDRLNPQRLTIHATRATT